MVDYHIKWRFKVNHNKSTYTHTQLLQFDCKIYVQMYCFFNGFPIPTFPTIKYLGIKLDKRLNVGPSYKRKTANSEQSYSYA